MSDLYDKGERRRRYCIIERGTMEAGVYYRATMPDGTKFESAYEGAVMNMIDNWWESCNKVQYDVD